MATQQALSAAAPGAPTPATVSPCDLYQQYQDSTWTKVLGLTHEGHLFEAFKKESKDADSSSPIFRDGKYYLSWHVATMILSDGYYSILPLEGGWADQFSDNELGLLLSSLKKLEEDLPWGLFLRRMNRFRVYREEDAIPFSERIEAIYLD